MTPRPARKITRQIGWKEKVDLPALGISGLDAKVDTGARTSVLHCSGMETFKKGRKTWVRFQVLDETHPAWTGNKFELPFTAARKIKNSFGEEEERLVVITELLLFGKTFPIELSLRDRSNMEFPMLLGRSAIRGRFLVNVGRSDLSYKRKIKRRAV